MPERTEIEKVIQAPVEITLGGGKYRVSPLPIKYSVPWVKKLIKVFVSTAALAKLNVTDESTVEAAINETMVKDPEFLAELFWEYTRLDRDKLEEVASSSEIMAGFREVLRFELPFLRGMNMLNIISPMALPSKR